MKSSLSGLCAQNLEHKFNTSPEIKAAWSLYRNLKKIRMQMRRPLRRNLCKAKNS